MRKVLTIVTALLLVGCDVVSSRYETLPDATEYNLVDRGWLPSILPRSSTDIETNNDLDFNISWGEFHFAPAEFAEFEMHLGVPAANAPFEGWARTMQNYAERGFLVLGYTKETQIWVFFCRPKSGYCEYQMWVDNWDG